MSGMQEFIWETAMESTQKTQAKKTDELPEAKPASGNRESTQQNVAQAKNGSLQPAAGNKGTNAALEPGGNKGKKGADKAGAGKAEPGDVIEGYVVYEKELRKGGTLAWRNNNPGNIRPGAFTEKHGAYKGKKNSNFAIFPTYEKGFAAIKALMKTSTYSGLTIIDAINKYAPPSDGNDPAKYAASINKMTGLDTSRTVGSLTDEELGKMATAIQRVEGYKAGTTHTRTDPKLPKTVRDKLGDGNAPDKEQKGQGSSPEKEAEAGKTDAGKAPAGKDADGGGEGSTTSPKGDDSSAGGTTAEKPQGTKDAEQGKKKTIDASVGEGGVNKKEDVKAVQTQLKAKGADPKGIDGKVGPNTIAAIKAFQKGFLSDPDGLVEPGKKTATKLFAEGGSKEQVSGPAQRKADQEVKDAGPDAQKEQQQAQGSKDKKETVKSADKGVPKAPATGEFWPIKGGSNKTVATTGGRSFKALRSGGKRYHVGIDVYGSHGDPVVACEAGTIVAFYHFYHGVNALLVEHGKVVVNYGEVSGDSLKKLGLKVGSTVKAGQQIGTVGKMSGGSSMLHFETYTKGTKSNKRWMVGQKLPKELMDPTEYLQSLK